jgi:hypothetical protein
MNLEQFSGHLKQLNRSEGKRGRQTERRFTSPRQETVDDKTALFFYTVPSPFPH